LFYGQEEIAKLCARFITHLFACPESPPTSSSISTRLPYFIAYALHRTKLNPSVTFAALVLLQRLKARFPTARGSSGHRLFISAFMIASKVICDDTYSNKSWSIVAQGMFNLREINQMEREMCSYLEWELTVDGKILQNFDQRIRVDFASPTGPYPTYELKDVSKDPAPRKAKGPSSQSSTPVPVPVPHTTTSAIPSFGQQHPPHMHQQQPIGMAMSVTPPTPDTPLTSTSATTSPASSVSPQTPVGMEDDSVRVEGSPDLSIRRSKPVDGGHPLKAKMFAMAKPSIW